MIFGCLTPTETRQRHQHALGSRDVPLEVLPPAAQPTVGVPANVSAAGEMAGGLWFAVAADDDVAGWQQADGAVGVQGRVGQDGSQASRMA